MKLGQSTASKLRFIAASVVCGFCFPWLALSQELDISYPGGASDEIKDAINAASQTRAILRDEEAPTPQDVIAAAQADYRGYLSALYDLGYLEPEISIRADGQEVSELSLFQARRALNRIEVSIKPGRRFVFSEARITPLAEETELPEVFAPGEPASIGAIRDAGVAAIEGWRDQGHAKAELAGQEIVAFPEQAQARAVLRIEPGPKLRFGNVVFTEESSVNRPGRLRDIADIPEGKPFSPQIMEDAARRLRDTGVFSSVTIREAETPSEDDTLDLVVDLRDRKPRRFGAGLEYDTDQGGTISAFWLHRNLFGGAERFRVDGEIGGIGAPDGTGFDGSGLDYRLAATLSRPATLDSETTLTFGIELEREDDPEFLNTSFEAEIGLRKRVDDQFSVRGSIGVRFQETEDDEFGTRNFEHFFARGGATHDGRDDQLDPRSGIYADGELMPFIGFDGEGGGIRFTGDIRGYSSFGENERVTIAARTQFGIIEGSSIEDTPPDDLFFSGGGSTVRGHSFQSLGVDLDNGTVGGRSWLGLSGEVRARFTERLGAVLFYDYGLIGEDSLPNSDSEDQAGAGVGARYFTPIGPIRVDLGFPVAGDSDPGDFGIYIGIGQAF